MQLTINDLFKRPLSIDKPIRLIELFGGVGSQAMALRNIGANFEHYKLVEFDKYPVTSYNAIHGTNFEPLDIRNVHGEDLEIIDTKKYTYILTYSFHCQDLSLAGKQRGMTKGTGTRSGLLWEVERLLTECYHLSDRYDANYGMPQVLVMENVPQVHSKANLPDFEQWCDFLRNMGYESYYQDMNARDYGVAQNRNRCFMVSVLGDYYYKFPKTIPLRGRVKDILDENPEEKCFMISQKAKDLVEELADEKIFTKPTKRLRLLGCMDCSDGTLEKDNRVYDMNGVAATITCGSASVQGKYLDIRETDKDGDFVYEIKGEKYLLRVRKITPIECWRLMGFTDEDFYKAEKVNSNTQLYKQAGNSIVCDCLEAIFSQMNIQGVIPWNEKRESIYPDQ